MRIIVATLILLALGGCYDQRCNVSKIDVGMSIDQVITICGRANDINGGAELHQDGSKGDDQQWWYWHGVSHVDYVHFVNGKVVYARGDQS